VKRTKIIKKPTNKSNNLPGITPQPVRKSNRTKIPSKKYPAAQWEILRP
jgi:hypothetical protein